MVVVHRVFRREFRLLPQIVRAVRPGDTGRAGHVAQHADELMTALHHHHTGEDELLWPLLRERASTSAELVATMERQHEHVAELLDTAGELLARWRDTADAETGEQLAGVLDELSAGLDEHLEAEERQILPLAADHLSVEEWAELGRRGMAAIPKDRLLLFLGYMLEEADRGERTEMLGRLPTMARVAYRVVGQRRYQREVAVLRSGVEVPYQR